MKVKVRRGPGLTGSQKNYGLVTGSIWNYEDKPTSNNVGTTLSAVPRDEATIEAERGETVIGDLDNDGMVEHAKIGGKRHSHGGTPLNVPDGSFVFSDYRGLLIKNKDVLKNIFGMNTNKAVTPAKVAQRYEINKFKNMLNDPFIDPIDRKTAQLMIDNNMRKLGQLALIQEGMKGFPDGIPAIAQPLMGSDFAQQGGQQMMRKGGIVSFKKGGPAKYQGKDRSQVDLSGYNDMRQIPINLKAPEQELPDWLHDIDQDGSITSNDLDMYNAYKEYQTQQDFLAQARGDAMGNFSGVRDNTNLMSPQRYTGPLYTDLTLDNGMVITAQDQIARDNYLAQLQNGENPNGTISQTPDYKDPSSWRYYANTAADVAMNPGSALMYAMTPNEHRRFGAYLQDNTNPVGNALDMWAASQTGLTPYVGGLTSQLFLQNPELYNKFMHGDKNGNVSQAGMLGNYGPLEDYAEKLALLYGAKYGFKALANGPIGKNLGKAYTWGKYKMFPGLDPNSERSLMNEALANASGIQPNTLQKMFGTHRPLGAVGSALGATRRFLGNTVGKATPYINPFSPGGKGIPGAAALWEAGNWGYDKLFVDPYEIPDNALDANTGSSEDIEYNTEKIKYTPIKVQEVKEDNQPVKVESSTTPAKKKPAKKKVRLVKKPGVGTTTGNAVILNMDSVKNFKSGQNQIKEMGGSLDHYQGRDKSQVFTQYTPESQELNTQDYDIVNPNIDIPYGFTVQHFDPKLGYYTITNPTTGQTIPLDMDNFVNVRHGALLDTYGGGRNAWRENALSQDAATREAANDWFQGTYEDWRKQKKMKSYFYGDPTKSPYGRDKKLGIYTWSAPGIVPRVIPPPPAEQPQPKEEETKISPPNWQKTKTRYPGPRRADLLGEAAAAMQEIRRYPSMYAPINNAPVETIYDRFNPQNIMGAYTTALQNAGTGPDSARAIDNVTGKVLEGVAQGQEQVQTQVNNPRFMQMVAQNQQAKMKADAYNAAEAIRFQDDVANKWQDYLANYNKKLANVAEKAATTGENQYKLALVKAMYPYANLDFDQPTTANATLNSITDEPIASSGTISDNFSATYDTVLNRYLKQGLSPEKAAEQANAYMRNYIAMSKAGTGSALTDPFKIIEG